MKTATEYARVSKDKSGRLRSVTEQSTENRDASEDNGWEWLPTTYAEEGDVSASAFGTVSRVGFGALLADLRGGAFPADVLVLWEASRGSRQMREWVDLIEALAVEGVLVYVTSEDRTYDVRKPSDRRDLQSAANEAEYFSGRLSVTLKRAHRAQARDGRWSGRAPFGYKRVWSADGEVSQVEDPAAAPYVRQAYDHIVNGGSISSLVRRWNESGETGRTWTTQALRVVLLNPAYVGIRVHTPRSRNESRNAAAARRRASTEHEAAWPAIVDRATAHEVQRILSDPTRLKQRSSSVTHPLSGIAQCGVCGRPLSARQASGRTVYRCPTGCVQIAKDDADRHVSRVTIAFLARESVGPVSDADAAGVAKARADIAAAEEYLREVELAAEGDTSPLIVAKMQANGEARLRTAQAALRLASVPDALADVLPTESMTDAVWKRMGVTGQRRVLRVLYGPDGIVGPLRVLRGARGRTVPVAERVSFIEKSAQSEKVAPVT